MSDLPSLDDALEETVRDERHDALLGPDGPDGRALAQAVGSNIERLRRKRSMTREELARRTDVTLAILERPHRYENPGDTETTAHLVMSYAARS